MIWIQDVLFRQPHVHVARAEQMRTQIKLALMQVEEMNMREEGELKLNNGGWIFKSGELILENVLENREWLKS